MHNSVVRELMKSGPGDPRSLVHPRDGRIHTFAEHLVDARPRWHLDSLANALPLGRNLILRRLLFHAVQARVRRQVVAGALNRHAGDLHGRSRLPLAVPIGGSAETNTHVLAEAVREVLEAALDLLVCLLKLMDRPLRHLKLAT